MKLAMVAIGLCCLMATPAWSQAPAPSSPALSDTARTNRWHRELDFTVETVRRVHPRPFAFSQPDRFDSAVTAIRTGIPQWPDTRIAVEMMRLVASLGDGHTLLIGTFPAMGFTHFLPVRLRPFEDGLHVTAVAPGHENLLGGRVLSIGGVPADEALRRVASTQSGDNEFTRLDRVPLMFMIPEVLQSLGLSTSGERVPCEIEIGGRKRVVSIASAPPPPEFPMRLIDGDAPIPDGWTSARQTGSRPPALHRRNPERAWWFEYMPDRRLLYVQLRRVEPMDGDVLFGDFIQRLFAFADSAGAKAFVLDIRHNHGGNNTILQPLIHGLIKRDSLNRKGALFTIIGRGTFSAAQNCANWMEEHTRTLFVGEPTGGRPNHYGDARQFTSPAGLMLQVSQWPWAARLPWDDRLWIAPQVPATETFATWRADRDVALESIFDLVDHGTLGDRVRVAADRGGLEAARAAHAAWQKERPSRWGVTTESELRSLGAALLERKQPALAVIAYQVATDAYPGSARSWGSLAWAQFEAGDRSGAAASARKALGIQAGYGPATALLQRLGEKP